MNEVFSLMRKDMLSFAKGKTLQQFCILPSAFCIRAQPDKLKFLDISCHLCYNTPDVTGKQVRFLHEPVAVKRMLGYAEQGSVLPLAAKEEQGHWERSRSREGRQPGAQSKYPSIPQKLRSTPGKTAMTGWEENHSVSKEKSKHEHDTHS